MFILFKFITFQLLAILAASACSSELKDKALSEAKDDTKSLSRISRHVDIDPHETLCWDVSIYTDVTFDQEPCEKCMPRLDTVKKPLKTQVCNNWKIKILFEKNLLCDLLLQFITTYFYMCL